MASSIGIAKSQPPSLYTSPTSLYSVGTDGVLDYVDELEAGDESEAGDDFDTGALLRVASAGDDDDDLESDSGEEDDSDYSDSDSCGESTYSATERSGSISNADFSEDDEYLDLMASMPITLGREGGPSLPTMTWPPSQAPLPTVPCEDGAPLEGLAMLQSLRGELEKVGRIIVAKNDGEGFLAGAHILASINMLATQVPSCVLEHLGNEIKQSLDFNPDFSHLKAADSLVTSSTDFDYSCASDISEGEMDMGDGCDFTVDKMPVTPKASRKGMSSGASAATAKISFDSSGCSQLATEDTIPSVSYFECALVTIWAQAQMSAGSAPAQFTVPLYQQLHSM